MTSGSDMFPDSQKFNVDEMRKNWGICSILWIFENDNYLECFKKF